MIDYADEYRKDIKLDVSRLVEQLADCPSLHHKYSTYYRHERLKYHRLLREMDVLLRDKHGFYKRGPTKETEAMGWEARNEKILNQDIPMYMRADKEIQELQKMIDETKTDMDLLKDYQTQISFRANTIRTLMEELRFQEGA